MGGCREGPGAQPALRRGQAPSAAPPAAPKQPDGLQGHAQQRGPGFPNPSVGPKETTLGLSATCKARGAVCAPSASGARDVGVMQEPEGLWELQTPRVESNRLSFLAL